MKKTYRNKTVLVQALYAISKTTGFLARTLDGSSRKADDILEKEYLYNLFEMTKNGGGTVLKKAGSKLSKFDKLVEKKLFS